MTYLRAKLLFVLHSLTHSMTFYLLTFYNSKHRLQNFLCKRGKHFFYAELDKSLGYFFLFWTTTQQYSFAPNIFYNFPFIGIQKLQTLGQIEIKFAILKFYFSNLELSRKVLFLAIEFETIDLSQGLILDGKSVNAAPA